MRSLLVRAIALSAGLLLLHSSSAQEVVAKKSVSGSITSVDKSADTFTLDYKGTPLVLTIIKETKGANEIVKGRSVNVTYGKSLDSGEFLALLVKAKKSSAKPANGDSEDETAPAPTKPAGPKKVRATGSGVDADAARQAAFTQAIETEVGLLVDSKTTVVGDDIVEDIVRTFSKGKVNSYKVIKEWQEDGLHHATIEATIGVDELAGQLTARKVPIHRIDGEKIARQGVYDRAQKDKGGEFVSDDFPVYKLTDYLKAELADKPKIEGAQTGVATMTVTVNVASDLKNWPKMADQMTRVLKRTLPRSGITIPPHSTTMPRASTTAASAMLGRVPTAIDSAAQAKLRQRGDNWAYLVMVAKGLGDSGPNATYTWEGIEVPKGAFETIADQLSDRRYFLRVALKDDEGDVVQEQETQLITDHVFLRSGLLARVRCRDRAPFSYVYVGPYLFTRYATIHDPLGSRQSLELTVSTDDLKRVKEVTAEVVERVPDATP